MADSRFPRIVSLACHDLRTPLATVYGFARTLTRSGELDERSARFMGMIEEASEQMTTLLDELGVAARIAGERWEPALVEADTLELATSTDERVRAEGAGTGLETDRDSVARALEAFAIAAVRHGPVEHVVWKVDGRSLALSPITAAAAPVLLGEELKDLGSIVGRMAVEELGGSVAIDGETLRVDL
jgi:signal transduction histidine kinase